MWQWIKKFCRACRQAGWAILAGLAFIAGLFLRRGGSNQPIPHYTEDAEREAEHLEVQAQQEIAEVEHQAEAERQEIEEVERIEDDRERLQRLADLVNEKESDR